jgi:cyclopropane fatty-acyl-phospholipid synthase-like methyltransferase
MKSIEKNFKRKPINIKILEIGAGWGSWSLFAKACNFKIEAIEVSSSRLSYIKKNNIKIYNNINKINKKKYDLIYLDQTLEHLESPYKTLNIIKKILSKNGLLIIKVPSGLFTKKKLFNDYIFHEDELIPLEHINIFNYKTFNYISKKYNFRFKFLFSKYPPNSILYYKDLIKNFYYYLTNKMVIFKNSN